jgi:hypothetical protein
MFNHSYHVESLCSISWGLDALIGTTCILCCQVDEVVVAFVVEVELSMLLPCSQVVNIINELLLKNYVKH